MPWDQFLVMVLGSLRAIGVVMALPLPGGRGLPPPWRAALSLVFGGLLAAGSPVAEIPIMNLPDLAEAVFHEMLLGLAMGFLVRAVLGTADLAGRLIATEVGIIAAPGMDVPTPSQEPLPTFIAMFAGVMFFAFGAHHSVLAAFAQSYTLVGAGAGTIAAGASETLVSAVAGLIEVAVRMAAPFIALNFIITLGFSVLGRAVPKMNVFILSYSLRSMVGFLLLAGAGTLLARYLSMAFEKLPWQMLEVVGSRS
jgi:flagellar biosynthesis protein FliR